MDQIDDFIPPKPGFRNNEMNKYIHKNKIVVSSVSKGPVDTDRINDILNSYRELDGDAAVKIAEIDNVKDKTIKKIAEAANKYNNRTTRASLKSLNTLNHLNDYWVERQRRYKEDLKSKGKKVYDDDYGISQYYTGEYLDEDDDEDDTRVSFQGRLFDSKSADQLNLYRELSAMGWDAMKLARTRNISKGVMKVFKRDEKSKKKGKKKKDQFNATVADIIADGNYDSFEDYQNEMQNVTISSLFR